MNLKSSKVFTISQLIFGLSLLGCIFLIPHYLLDLDQGGLSNYGTEALTKPLFILGFLAAAYGAMHVARQTVINKNLQIGLYLLMAAYILVMISTFTYKTNSAIEASHNLSSILLYLVMAVIIWLVRDSITGEYRLKIALIVFISGSLIGFLTIITLLTQLLTAQLMTGLSFGYLLVASLQTNK